jgi:saccharopine dehydrogenase-like NADP-dependent oxidoreductase
MVGGIPEELVPPLNYTITWSAEGLIDEYVREVSIIQDGKTVQVPALSGLEEIEFPGVGTLEAFYTDGLRSLAKTFPEVENMYEKTLRYPGHVEKVKLLRELGYFSDEPLTVGGKEVSPRLVTARLLERSLWKPEVGDLLAMRIQILGEKKGKKTGYRHQILDRYDHETDVSAMARTTAYTASIVAGMLAKGTIDVKGVIPPEKLGMDTKFSETLISELKSRGVIVEETVL